MLNTVIMAVVSTCGSTGVSPPPLSSQNIQSHEKSPTSPKARDEAPSMSLALDTNPEGKERVKGEADWLLSYCVLCVLPHDVGCHIIIIYWLYVPL